MMLLAALCAGGAAAAADASGQPAERTKPAGHTPLAVMSAGGGSAGAVASAAAPSLFSQPVILRGRLGDAQVQFNLRPKTEFEGGVEGDYFVFGSSAKVLLAGEYEGEEVFLEESENGTDVSGQWNGKLSASGFSGEWQSADGTVTRPFALTAVRTDERSQPAKTPAQKKP